MLPAAPSFGQPQPTCLLGRAGLPYRPRFHHSIATAATNEMMQLHAYTICIYHTGIATAATDEMMQLQFNVAGGCPGVRPQP
eukprot:scaffold98692_cov48-Phaeocystis_antarctica.AAC.2